ncbi:MAG: tRNA 2-thiouridine(34) synthase MnmA [Anaerolineae bacterium]|nr:tRNA 2-thiouridine(34) synthase MnmA [Thermoflexales bacterium]MDW8408024.1 tRNA 2-thiouridine(34) synthase MnmA [Anaerolineae bacterium]
MTVHLPPAGTRVVVAMSGGVDSSVAAALLVERGYDVIGIMLRLWAEPSQGQGKENSNRCCAPEAVADARAIARQLGIPFYDIHAESVFKQHVVDPWITAYGEAATPNPCFNCNRFIRFGFLMQRARALGAAYLATGHYARIDTVPAEPRSELPVRYRLLKGVDAKKDQSYVLHVLGQRDLARALFPCGEFTKEHVRDLARRFGLPVAERAESQDLCFLTQGDYRSFLVRQAPDVAVPGPILNTRGEVIGRHEGLPFYTVGQRRGLDIAPKSAHAEPLYVLRLDSARNALIVGRADELGTRRLTVRSMHYVSGKAPTAPVRCTAKVRYKAREASCVLTPLENGAAQVEFDEVQRDATPGQGLVAYDGDEVIGGGIIARTE